MDISETDKEFQITADLPGFDPQDVNVEVEEDGIAISGKHESEEKKEDTNYLRCERRSGSFYRKVVLPHSADLLKIKCKSRNGVLHVSIPKKDDSKRKSVKIEVEE
ncbi:Hsp20/alpha crystallin family protein [Candidatus Gracilibacteria bacterium]|nr:Hsp20/alpha crystallin family protein [Candidatus Gracilibacteria bacterium]